MGVTQLGVWAIVALLGLISCIVWRGLQATRVQHKHAMTMLNALGDTHRAGFETLGLVMQKLEARVEALEARRQ